jgi:hypothetical protein
VLSVSSLQNDVLYHGTYLAFKEIDPAAKDTAIRLLLTQRLHNQVFFRTTRVVDCLEYLETRDVYFR